MVKMQQERTMYFGQSLVILLGLAYFSNAQSNSCPPITINDLGSTTEFSSNGLVSRTLSLDTGEAGAIIPVRIRNFAIVCDASGDRINTSSYVSLVVEFHCNFQSSATPSLAVCSDPSTIVTRQYQFQCVEDNGQPVWGALVAGSNLFVQTLNPTATLSTPLADQCRRCIDDQQSSTNVDSNTHCNCEFISLINFINYDRSFHIFTQSQYVQLDVTGDRGAAILGRKGMCAVTSTCKGAAQLIARVLWWLIPTSTVVSMKSVCTFFFCCI